MTALEAPSLDLTRLNATMLYAQLYDMVLNPEAYCGKTVRMKGAYATVMDESTSKRHHACFISDAAACCAQGVEFVATNAPAYPADYPPAGSTITVQGVFDTYMQDGGQYAYIRDAVLISGLSPKKGG